MAEIGTETADPLRDIFRRWPPAAVAGRDEDSKERVEGAPE